jgi:ubiquinone/menaquinone biosynthesis C-methylase UbiE
MIKSAEEIFNEFAPDYARMFMDAPNYNQALDKLLEFHQLPNFELCDLACGPANLSFYLLKKEPRLQITGVDIAESMIDIAKQNIPQGNFDVDDVRYLELEDEKFSIVLNGFCLPYLTEVEAIELMDVTANALKPNGLLFLSTMIADATHSVLQTNSKGDQTQMQYYDVDTIEDMLESAGFTILCREEQLTKDANINDYLIIARKS